MLAYENGGHMYHATLPTDALAAFRDAMQETVNTGLTLVKSQQWELGRRVRAVLAQKGFPSVAAPGFEAPGAVVSYTDDDQIHNGRKFIEQGMQTAAGVPLMCDEPADYKNVSSWPFRARQTAKYIEQTVSDLDKALTAIQSIAKTTA